MEGKVPVIVNKKKSYKHMSNFVWSPSYGSLNLQIRKYYDLVIKEEILPIVIF